MKIVIVDKSNPDQKKYLTKDNKWDHRIKYAKDWEVSAARKTLTQLSAYNPHLEIQAY